MPNRTDQILFLSGLVLFMLGQVQLNLLGPASQSQAPIDWAHWTLLLGASLLIPFAARLPRTLFGSIAGIILIAGIVFIIGMNAIDFVFWGLDDEMDGQLYRAIVDEPAIWGVFMRWGPGEIFTTGIGLPSLLYWRRSRLGTGLVALGLAIMIFGTQWYNVIGYSVVTAGYFLNFDRLGLFGGARPQTPGEGTTS